MEENKTNPTIEERIDEVLEKLRPFLAREGGNIRLEKFDPETGICYVDMIGACAGCSLAASDVSDSVEVMLMDEIPEITKVELIAPSVDDEFDTLLKQLQKAQAEEEAKEKTEKENAKEGEGNA
ncbi:MAG: NifU family protein [Bacilli bacterium]